MDTSGFRAAFDARLRRRRAAVGMEGARKGGRRALVAAFAVLLLCALGVLPAPPGPITAVGSLALLLVGGAALGAVSALRDRGTASALVGDMDRLLARGDLVATARAVSLRSVAPGRFGEAVVERAAEAVAGIPQESLGPLPRPPWKLLGVAALVALLLALLPQGGFGVLPGLGSGWGTGGRPRAGGANWGEPGEKRDGAPRPEPEGRKTPEAGPGENPPEPEARKPVASLAATPLTRKQGSVGPVPVFVAAKGLEGAGSGADLELFVSVDGGDAAGEGRARRIAAGQRDARVVDLRSGFPPLLASLGPGKHRVAAGLRDGEGRVVAKAEEFEIEVEGSGDSGGSGPKPAEKQPQPQPQQQPQPQPHPQPEGGKPAPGPALPPSILERKMVQPLFREGPQAVKKGPILVLDPSGGRGAPPREVPPEEVLAEVRAGAEAAARREGIDPRDIETVRLYFEALRRIVEAGK